MHILRFSPIRSVIIVLMLLIPLTPANGEVRSLDLIDVYATLPDETAQIGLFESGQQIDLLFQFELGADSSDMARLTWDVYDRHGHKAFSSEREYPCQDGMNSIRIENAIPINLGIGNQIYEVYASVGVGGMKDDEEFEIRIDNPQAFPGVMIEDVRLAPREDDFLADEIGNAAIPYTLEIDFRVENIISWARAEIRWLGVTADGFVLDRGIGTTSVDDGFNTFDVDGLLARPPRGATPQADFSVEVLFFGYFDSVTFPIDTLPVSLIGIHSSRGVPESEYAFSVGEAHMLTEDNVRVGFFGKNESISARLLTGGMVPQNTILLMRLSGGPDESMEEYSIQLEAGTEMPIVDFHLPMDIEREPGFYDFTWVVIVGEMLFAERTTNLTISGRQGFSVPIVVDLPGDSEFIAPLSWKVTLESEPGLYATMLTPDGVVCRLMGNPMDEPLNVNFLADIFESTSSLSGIPADATSLTSEANEIEGMLESIRRTYLGDGKIFVHDYWLYRVEHGEYQFLIATSVADEESITEAYSASDEIRTGLDFGY